jgi:uroporphyrinogen-III synthase
MRVALFRAPDDARNSAARFAAHGFEAVIAPVMAPVALEATAPPGGFDAVVATSAKALDLASPALFVPLAGVPLYVVGEAGEAAAARRGLSVAASAGDAGCLARVLETSLPPRARVLYLAGVDRKLDLEAALIRVPFSVATVEVYAARARDGWSPDEAQAVASCGAALHYSRRSAELALLLAERAGILSQWRAMPHVAISADAAEPLGASGATKVIVAAAAREEAMLAALVCAHAD